MSVLVIHVCCADWALTLTDDVNHIAGFLKHIYSMIDDVIKDCGLLKVSEFSGVYIAAASPEFRSANSVDSSHRMKAVQAARKIQLKISKFNKLKNLHIKLGIGLKQGPVCMGFINESNFVFDIIGEVRDLAYLFSTTNNDDDAIISTEYSNEIDEVFFFDEITKRKAKLTLNSTEVDVFRVAFSGYNKFNNGLQLKDFQYLHKLGEGGYASVHLLREISGCTDYAIKSIRKYRGGSNFNLIQREFFIFQQMEHDNIVSFKYCLETKSRVFLVMDYVAGGNLNEVLQHIDTETRVNRYSILRNWFGELALALKYLHSRRIIHRDVKPVRINVQRSINFIYLLIK
jgi:hypothetical protein